MYFVDQKTWKNNRNELTNSFMLNRSEVIDPNINKQIALSQLNTFLPPSGVTSNQLEDPLIIGGIFSGIIYATGGTVGGWIIHPTTLSTATIVLDSASQQIDVGTGGNRITFDGPTGSISSTANTWQLFGSGVTKGMVKKSNVLASRQGDLASGTQVIAHGLGKIPDRVFIAANKLIGTNTVAWSRGVFDASGQNCLYETLDNRGFLADYIYKEVPSGAVDGLNKVFVLANTIRQIANVWVDGGIYLGGVAVTFSNTITLDDAPTTSIFVDYWEDVSTGTSPSADSSSGNSIFIQDGVDDAGTQEATITVDATNVTIAWTKTGTTTANNIHLSILTEG